MKKHEVWTKGLIKNTCITKDEIKKDSVRRLLLQAMMLLDEKYVTDFSIKDFSKKSLKKYEKSLRKNFSDKQENLLCSAIQYLTDAFPEKKMPVKKKDIPLLIYLADEAEDAGISPGQFWEWLVTLKNFL